jgi:sulfur carrier protein
MTIWLNGESRSVPDGLTLQALLEWLKLPGDRVAVERNLEIVPRARWKETTVVDGDRLEVVHLVGGGSPAPSHYSFSPMACRIRRRG